MRKHLAFWGMAAMMAVPALAQQQTLTPELLWKFGRVSEPLVSPDGKTVLYGVTWYDLAQNRGNRDLWAIRIPDAKPATTRSVAPPAEPVRLTDFPGTEYNAVWRPDGQKIAFISGESGSPQVWEMSPDGSNKKQITNLEDGVANFAYAPDMKHISFTQDVKLDKTVSEKYPDLPKANARIIDDLMYRHWDSWHDYAYSHVFIMDYQDGVVSGQPKDIMAGEKYDSPLNPMGGADHIAWTADGKSIAYTCKKSSGAAYAVSTNSDIYLYTLATGATRNLTEGMMGYDQSPIFSADGKYMAWNSMEHDGFESDKNRIYLMDLATGVKKDLTASFDGNAGGLNWARDNQRIFFVSDIKGTEQGFILDINTGKVTQATQGVHNYNTFADAGSRAIGLKCSMSMPHEIFVVDPATQAETALTIVNKDALSKIRMGKVESRTVRTTDGKDMLVWVVYPPDFDPKKKYPALLYCQGGPQSAVSQFFSTRWNFQLMAANGYIVVAPNRRGLPGFGQKWNDDISGDWGGQPMRDYLSAIDNVSAEPYVDKERLGCVGASYGGYSVYYLAGIHEKRFKAFISHCGLFNLESWYGTTEEMFFANWDLKGSYYQSPQSVSYQKFNPQQLVGNWDTPMLVIHGEKDFRVPIGEGMQAFSAAKLQGIPARFLYFPEEGHWISSPQNSVLWHRVFYEWLDSYLKK